MLKNLSLIFLILIITSSCYRIRSSSGGGQTSFSPPRTINPDDIALLDGYQIEPVATGLTFPSGIDFDDEGNVYVIESGYAYGEVFTTPQLIRIDPDGQQTVMARGEKNGPWNGIKYYQGNFYIAEGGQIEGGKILRIDRNGRTEVLLENLPGYGDHHTNGPTISNDGYIYFGLGVATNSGVIGEDNYDFGWLNRFPEFSDIPCQNIILTGKNYETDNFLDQESGEKVKTGAFVPFGQETKEGQVIQGAIPCTGSVLRIPLEGGQPELVAWGFRNPFGLAIHPDGDLYITDNGYDVRGSRPVFGSGDFLWKVEQGKWYGWPDFMGGIPLDNPHAAPPGGDNPGNLLMEHPNAAPRPVASLDVHSSANGFDFSGNENFGFAGQAFIAMFGDMTPGVGKVLGPVGFKVVRVDVENGIIEDFVVNNGRRNGPASKLGSGGLERPVAVRFHPDGNSMYIVDFGVMLTEGNGPQPVKETGVIWKVTRSQEVTLKGE
ncbi:hypothetical protein BH23BAC1_BH23BAC1_07210 [soil metagenome]